jgi:hypothetical protein
MPQHSVGDPSAEHEQAEERERQDRGNEHAVIVAVPRGRGQWQE